MSSAETEQWVSRVSIGDYHSVDAALAELEAALPHKRWTVTLEGDWEDGWVASATSRVAGGPGIEVSTSDQGWGADRGGLATPAAALRALATKLKEQADSHIPPESV